MAKQRIEEISRELELFESDVICFSCLNPIRYYKFLEKITIEEGHAIIKDNFTTLPIVKRVFCRSKGELQKKHFCISCLLEKLPKREERCAICGRRPNSEFGVEHCLPEFLVYTEIRTCSLNCSKLILKNMKRKGAAFFCQNCFKVVEKRMSCSRCRKSYYCSKECQKKDWPDHKTYCRDAQIS